MYPLSSSLSVLESTTNLLSGDHTSDRARFQLDVVLEHVVLSHKVALTDKQLRIIVQRDNKRIQSDASGWRNERADFQQVVGLQSTLTRLAPNGSSKTSQPAYESKVYQFLIQALPSQSQVASFELDIALFVNQTATVKLTPVSGLDARASLTLSVRCNAVKSKIVEATGAMGVRTPSCRSSILQPNGNNATAPGARSSNNTSYTGGNSFKRELSRGGQSSMHRRSSGPVRSSNLTDTSSLVHGQQQLDSASEYAEDLAQENETLVKKVAELEKQNLRLEEAVIAANATIDLMRRELDELRLREAGETTRGLQLKAWNLALVQEFEILRLQQHQIAAGAPVTLVNDDLLRRIECLTKEAYETPDSLYSDLDEPVTEPDLSDLDDDASSSDEDSNFNFDPAAPSDVEDSQVVESAVTKTTNALIEDLRQLLARNQRLVQDTQLLIYAASDTPVLPAAAPSVMPDLSANIDIHSQRKHTQELETQNRFLQAMTKQQLKERATFDVLQRERAEVAQMAAEEARMWQVRHDELFRTVVVVPPPPGPVAPPPPPPAAPPSPHNVSTPVAEAAKRRSAATANELTKHVQMLKQENLALKYKNTTLESYQEKYEECEKQRKRLEVRLMAQTNIGDVPRQRAMTIRSNGGDDGEDSDVFQLTVQRAAALDMQLNVLKELSRTQAMRIATMNDEHVKMRLDFAHHVDVMKTRVVQLEAAAARPPAAIA
ncbi:hypothetical protein H310_12969 [Aphanomyces invadans]|uniref:C2 NT-type domain-containing protein n=1 Tax=Aphanomyces invadans TaxID=157072 RepID=A0A024TFQ9_9STRA|nr:hypothetical protein H310_12969 [Aphanomyces invadans]ETV92985.1 hypothetical protein H310_12969 [Aphanomyces invadans]|eukprot:XP_008878506.1 hypothetical protein H310_12969 [Aphanomyces invadans]